MIEDRFKYTKKPKVLFCTGAGASKESGINTFRDPQTGYWRRFDPAVIASVKALENDPSEVNKFYNERRVALGEVEPNYFHEFIALMQNKYGADRIAVMTTNVDDLHERTGIESLYKIHGSIREIVTFEGEVIDLGYRALNGEDLLSCRPNVVMFGEGAYIKNGKLFHPYLEVERVISSLNPHDLMFIVGSSGSVVNFQSLAMGHKNIYIVDPNLTSNECQISGFEKLIRRSACDAVPEIEDLISQYLE